MLSRILSRQSLYASIMLGIAAGIGAMVAYGAAEEARVVEADRV